MENTAELGQDSNSESDISDSWALIDEESSVEWSCDIGEGLGVTPRQYVFESNEVPVPRTSSGNELSDEDSIEVVPEDHTDNLSDNEAQEASGEKWIMTESVDLDKSKQDTTVKEHLIPEAQPPSSPLKKYTECTLLLITLLIMALLGGISLGYSWGTHASQPYPHKGSASAQDSRALLAKLRNENLILRSQLRAAHSSLKFDTSKVAKLSDIMKLDALTESKVKPYDVDYSGMCTITDFIRRSSLLTNNVTNDFCLATDIPLQNELVSPSNSDEDHAVFSAKNASLSNEHLNKTNNLDTKVSYTDLNRAIAVEAKEVDKTTSPVLSESASVLHYANSPDEVLRSEYTPHLVEHPGSEIHEGQVKNMESGMDPRPYAKLRAIVEDVYTVFSLLGNDIQTKLPSKPELLSILPENMAAFDFSLESLTSDNYEKVTAYKRRMQGTAQKFLVDVETAVNHFMHKIASKFKKFEVKSLKHICNLKRNLENSVDIGYLDWNTMPVFQKCNEYHQSGHDSMRDNGRVGVKDRLPEGKEQMESSLSVIPDHRKPNHKSKTQEEQGSIYYDQNQLNSNVQQTVPQYENFESKERSEFTHKNTGKRHKKSRKIKHNFEQNKKLKEHDHYIQQEETNFKHRSKTGQSEKEMHNKEWKDNKWDKVDEEDTNFKYRHHAKRDEKKILDKSNRDYQGMKKDKSMGNVDEDNISGEWALEMARGRAEQRRREHQSDWLFDRAESRKSSRGKNKGSYWHRFQGYAGNLFTSDMHNKTKALKEQASKAWKGMKHHVKENVWKPIVDTAKSAKRAYNDFNKYYSCLE